MTTTSPEVAQQMPETSFHFVFCEHTAENAGNIAKSLDDCDVIAFENVGLSSEDRWMNEQLFTIYVASATSETDRKQIESFYDNEDKQHWQLAVLGHLISSDKRVVLIDVPVEDSVHQRSEHADVARKRYFEKLTEEAPLHELEQHLHKELLTSAVSIIHRERLLVRQLEELANENPGMRIGVVEGAVHTGVQHYIDAFYKTDRQFVVPTRAFNKGSAKMNYVPELWAVRQLRFNLGKGLSEQALRGVLLHDLLFLETGVRISSENLKDLSPEEIDAHLAALDARRPKAGHKTTSSK